MNTYTFQTICTCPADKKGDVYRVKIKSRRMIWTNEIGKVAEALAREVIPQEEFTLRLARAIGAKVTTVGLHPAFVDESKPLVSPIKAKCTHGTA